MHAEAAASEPTTAEKIRALPWSVGSNAALTVFAQLVFFGSGYVLFLNELGLSRSQIGFLLSLVSFFGLLALFIAPTVARFGYKRTFLTFWGIRYVVTFLLLLIPWFASSYGTPAAIYIITGIVIVFSACRAIGVTGLVPWQQEYIPDAIKGKYFAINNIVTSLVGFFSVIAAGYVIGRSTDINRFTLLFAIGTVFGLGSIWAAKFIPGGGPSQEKDEKCHNFDGFLSGLGDRNFRSFLIGTSLVTLASGPLNSFLPLYMQEQVGLNAGQVVWLQTGTLIGGLLSSYLWGWTADRYGSKPVMLFGAGMLITLPVFWFFMPRETGWSLYVALAIAVFQGVANLGWAIGSTRLLFVGIIPAEKRVAYSALHTAWVGVVGGVSLLLGGRVLDFTAGLSGNFMAVKVDSFAVLFFAGALLSLASIWFLRRVQADSWVTIGEFAAMFLHGNPFVAVESLVRYHFAQSERAMVVTTERLGRTKSPLNIDELIEALSDPRFFVRFEAIISIAHREPDPRLLKALVKVLEGNEPALSVIAAWALGRLGDELALEPLRHGLQARYRSVQMHSARALGTLGDLSVIPALLDRLSWESDPGVQIAFASALGQLEAHEAIPELLKILRSNDDQAFRMEMALALARMVGEERNFIHLMREADADTSTACSQAVTSFINRFGRTLKNYPEFVRILGESANAFARGKLVIGAELINQAVRQVPEDRYHWASLTILRDCSLDLAANGENRLEYILLVLHTLKVGWQDG